MVLPLPGNKVLKTWTDWVLILPATSINDDQSLIAINTTNYNKKNPLIIIDWFKQSIKINTHQIVLIAIDYYWLLSMIINKNRYSTFRHWFILIPNTNQLLLILLIDCHWLMSPGNSLLHQQPNFTYQQRLRNANRSFQHTS